MSLEKSLTHLKEVTNKNRPYYEAFRTKEERIEEEKVNKTHELYTELCDPDLKLSLTGIPKYADENYDKINQSLTQDLVNAKLKQKFLSSYNKHFGASIKEGMVQSNTNDSSAWGRSATMHEDLYEIE